MARRIISLLVVLISTLAIAAPFWGDVKTVRQSDGSTIQVAVFGDEFYGRFESLDGYTLVKNSSGMFVYADVSKDGNSLLPLVAGYDPCSVPDMTSTTFTRSNAAVANGGVFPKSVNLSKAAIAKIVSAKRELYGMTGMESSGIQNIPGSFDPNTFTPRYSQPVLGAYQGLTLVIEFSDTTIPVPVFHDELGDGETVCVEDFCNMAGYTGGGNKGSVRDYYYGVSNGAVTYTNQVIAAYKAPESYEYYDLGYPGLYHELIATALQDLVADGSIDLTTLSTDAPGGLGAGNVLALNVFFAGEFGTDMLWPHKWNLSVTGDDVTINGYTFDVYQTTNMGTTTTSIDMMIGTFCHENGHMICGYADVYDYGYDSSGVGSYCLMAAGAWGDGGYNPAPINGYFRWLSGWEHPVYLDPEFEGEEKKILGHSKLAIDDTTLEGDWENFDPDTGNLYFFVNDEDTNEFFVLENMTGDGRNSSMPDTGMAIWHVDEAKGGYLANDEQDMTPSKHYYLSLEQADGLYDLEKYENNGDSTDLFGFPKYKEFNDGEEFQPNSLWWNNDPSGLRVYAITAPDGEMYFKYTISTKYVRVLSPKGADPLDKTAEVARYIHIQDAIDAVADQATFVADDGSTYTFAGDDYDFYVADSFTYYEFLDTRGMSLNF